MNHNNYHDGYNQNNQNYYFGVQNNETNPNQNQQNQSPLNLQDHQAFQYY